MYRLLKGPLRKLSDDGSERSGGELGENWNDLGANDIVKMVNALK